jgi:uncharacterized membrane protein
MAKIDDIKKGVDELRDRLLIKEPADFSMRDLTDSFFGALLLGLTFALKGMLVQVSSALQSIHLIMIVVSTLLLLTAEIYFIGYRRVKEKEKRKFCQFWLKRLVVFYLVAVAVALLLVYLFGLNLLPTVSANGMGVLKLVILISMPAAIGAAIADLLKKY